MPDNPIGNQSTKAMDAFVQFVNGLDIAQDDRAKIDFCSTGVLQLPESDPIPLSPDSNLDSATIGRYLRCSIVQNLVENRALGPISQYWLRDLAMKLPLLDYARLQDRAGLTLLWHATSVRMH